MNNQEAIGWLEQIKVSYIRGGDEDYDRRRKEAIGIAIEALEVQQELVGATNDIYAKGYNAAKREIALSGEYERAYHRGKVDATKWIPVSERLPEKGEVVLITNGKGNVRCGRYRSEHDVRDETHYWWWKGKTVETVIAWRPLPVPYKESDSK